MGAKKCTHNGCTKRASYGKRATKSRTHCGEHGRPLGLVDNANLHCAKCEKIAHFGIPGGKATHCLTHGRDLGMINVRTRRCTNPGCNIQATFGAEGSKKPTHCSSHGRPQGFVDVVNAKCAHPKCGVKPVFGPVSGRASHCAQHGRPLGFVDVINKRCAIGGCELTVNFGKPGEAATHCQAHGECLGFINVSRKTCRNPECNLSATYGPSGGRITMCAEHGREHGYVNLVTKRCASEGCMVMPSYGCKIGGKATHCAAHGSELNLIMVTGKRCGFKEHAFKCDVVIDPHHSFCASHDTERKRLSRVREIQVANFLRANASRLWSSWNRQIQDGKACGGAYRPDFVFDMGTYIIIIEVDEHQHAFRGYSCDEKRMVDIFNSYGGLPVVFIRWNPDSYCVAGKPRKTLLRSRLDLLLSELECQMATHPKHLLEVHRMFYDADADTKIQRAAIDISKGQFEESVIV